MAGGRPGLDLLRVGRVDLAERADRPVREAPARRSRCSRSWLHERALTGWKAHPPERASWGEMAFLEAGALHRQVPDVPGG